MGTYFIEFEHDDDEGLSHDRKLLARYAVCDRCRGEGVHDHPAFSNGITPEQFDEDPDFREEYMNGRYDVTCTECKGLRVVLVPDTDNCDQAILEEYYQMLQWKADFAAEVEAERRSGA
jgi:hypothetical protein